VQHNTNRVLAKIDSVKNIIATDFSGATEASQLAINEIGEVNIKLSKALYFDAYSDNKSNGAFILIDAANNNGGSWLYKLIPSSFSRRGDIDKRVDISLSVRELKCRC
jgi:sulfate adenylyltransferase subunit 1 (EFTu-like GTPase family)